MGQAPESQSAAADRTGDGFEELRAALGVPELEREALELALTHRSYSYEHGGLPTNERLEFLGDAVLGIVVTITLYHRHPDLSEGRLAKLRAAVVNARALAEVGRAVGVGPHLRLGRGEETTGGRDKPSILADTVEALLGAIFVQYGYDAATRVVQSLFGSLLDEAVTLGAALDWKTSLQELTSMHALGVPEYEVDESGPDHAKVFTATVRVGDERYGRGHGRSKKIAEQEAAESAWREIRERLGPAAAADPLLRDVD